MPGEYKIVERVTSKPDDWGVVRREHGAAVIGRVRESRALYLDTSDAFRSEFD